MSDPYRLFSWEHSYFSGKVRAYLRYKDFFGDPDRDGPKEAVKEKYIRLLREKWQWVGQEVREQISAMTNDPTKSRREAHKINTPEGEGFFHPDEMSAVLPESATRTDRDRLRPVRVTDFKTSALADDEDFWPRLSDRMESKCTKRTCDGDGRQKDI